MQEINKFLWQPVRPHLKWECVSGYREGGDIILFKHWDNRTHFKLFENKENKASSTLSKKWNARLLLLHQLCPKRLKIFFIRSSMHIYLSCFCVRVQQQRPEHILHSAKVQLFCFCPHFHSKRSDTFSLHTKWKFISKVWQKRCW